MNALALIHQSHDARVLASAEAALIRAMQAAGGAADRIRHRDLDCARQGQLHRRDVRDLARSFEACLLAWREAIAALAGDADTDVSDAEGFENALIGAFDRLHTVGESGERGERLGPSDCLEPRLAGVAR